MSWSVLRVTPNMERKVCETLREAGLSVLAPIERYRPANHWRPRTRPVMPGYIFVDLSEDGALDVARANYAVREVMCAEGRPVRVPAIAIGTLILLEAWGAFDGTWRKQHGRRNKRRGKRPTAAVSRWEHGQRVKITAGAFEGFVGQVFRADRVDRVEVLLSIFGRATAVDVDETALEDAA